MSHYEEIKIGRHEMGNYSNVIEKGSGENVYARVLINDDGSIDQSSYSSFSKQKQETTKESKVSKKSKSSDDDDTLWKIIVFPFKLIWWLIKAILWVLKILLIIVTFGAANGWFDGWFGDGKK